MATTLEQLTYELTQNAEGFNGQIHYDSKGIATLGSGVALIAYDADAVGNKYTMMETIGNVSIKRFLEIVTGNESVDSLITILKNDEDTLNQGNGHISSSSDFGINISLDFFISHIWGGEVGLYETYLNRSKHILDNVNTSIYPSLSDAEKAVVFSLTYTGAMGSNMAKALSHYISSDTEESFIGKMSAWYEILYHSNNNATVSDRPGQQNRRFMEANTFLTGSVATKPTEESAESVLDVNSYEEAKLVVAFMNSKAEEMIDYYKSGGFRGYANRSEEIVKKHFSFAVSSFLVNQNFTMEHNTNTLFQDWNLLIDLNIDLDNNGRPTGTTSYRNIEGSDVKDLIFITAEQDGMEVRAGSGDDFVGGSSYSDVVYAGSGNDIIHTYGGNDIVYTTDGLETDYNEVYLGAGNDKFFCGLGNDFVDGGSGNIDLDYISSNIGALDTVEDVNEVDLGSGQNRYIGSAGKDIVSGSGYNTVYLGAGSDEYLGGDGVDIVDGGSANTDYSIDEIGHVNEVHLGAGNDRYVGGIGTDKVWGENDEDAIYGGSGHDFLYGGDGNDYLYGEDGYDHMDGGAGNDSLDGGAGNDTILAGAGEDIIEPGTGVNTIDCGDDNDHDIIMIDNDANGIDWIKNFKLNDDIVCEGGFNLSTLQQVGNDVVVCGNRGNKVIFENRTLSDINLFEREGSGIAYGTSSNSSSSLSSQNASDLLTQALSTFGADSGSRTDMSEAGGTVSEMYDLACGYDLTKKAA